ncbi:MAG: hypothetical protein FJY10_11935, partial [Bacteroidetes bacterium]|nr:hypothetical protein [Bacteroidota bacterium]
LNILDYDYYFRITEHIIHGDITSTLLIINEILEKGFDGQHFLIGFGSHLRNLLVCKDEATLSLLETTPSVREKYKEQAAACPINRLVRMLDVINKCDQGYKSSNNKSLHLEISLIQICLPDEPEEPSPRVAATVPSASIASKPASPAAKTVSQPSDSKPLGNIKSTSLKTTSIKTTDNLKKEEGVAHAEEPAEDWEKPVSQESLEQAWKQFTDTLEASNPHLYSTLTKSKPILAAPSTIQYHLDNKVQEEELFERRAALLAFLRKALQNKHIMLQTEIDDTPQTNRPYTPREKFNHLAEKNPCLKELKEQLDLDIEY